MNDSKLSVLTVIAIVFVLFFAIFRGPFVEKSQAVKALEIQGYTDVQILDHKWLLVAVRGCSNSDAARFDASAKNPAGKQVNLFVCVGWPIKGSTVRTE